MIQKTEKLLEQALQKYQYVGPLFSPNSNNEKKLLQKSLLYFLKKKALFYIFLYKTLLFYYYFTLKPHIQSFSLKKMSYIFSRKKILRKHFLYLEKWDFLAPKNLIKLLYNLNKTPLKNCMLEQLSIYQNIFKNCPLKNCISKKINKI